MKADYFTLAAQLGAKSTASVFTIPARQLAKDDRRLEVAYYGSDGYQSLRAIEKSGYPLVPLESVGKVAQPPIFKRCFVDGPSYGVPYLNGIQLMEATPTPDLYLSKTQTAILDELILREGMVVILDAGQNAGEIVILATKDHDGYATTNNTIRITAHVESCSSEYLYVYLMTTAGSFSLTRSKYGSSIPHIEPSHVAAINVPLLPRHLRQEITGLVKRAAALRVKANERLREADYSVAKQAYLESHHYGRATQGAYEVGIVGSGSLMTEYEGITRIRLEATYQDVRARSIERHIQSKGKWARLREVVSAIPYTGPGSLPSVPKVDQQAGTPTVTGRDLGKGHLRPAYFLRTTHQPTIRKLRPAIGTTLVMCAGTPGKTEYVHRNFEDWFVSLDVIRVIPNPNALHPGYIFAFLSSALGQAQMLRLRYGSVIPRIHSRQIAEVCIPLPSDGGSATGDFVNDAFECRANARDLDQQAIELFQSAIQRGRRLTEAEWGGDY